MSATICDHSLFERIDEAKIALSSAEEASIGFEVPPHVSFSEQLDRGSFETIVEARVETARALVVGALASAGMEAEGIERVVRVGGSSRIPAFALMLDSLFPGRVSEGEVFTSISSGLIGAHEAGLSTA